MTYSYFSDLKNEDNLKNSNRRLPDEMASKKTKTREQIQAEDSKFNDHISSLYNNCNYKKSDNKKATEPVATTIIDDRLKNIEPKMIEMIMNEVLFIPLNF